MAISGIGSNYDSTYGTAYAAQKNEAAKKAEPKEPIARAGKGGRADSVSEYDSELRKKYSCVRDGSVSISGSYLKECAKNPEKAKELEENLSYFKEGYENGLRSAQANARAIGARVVSHRESWSIDSAGNVTMVASTTVTSDGGVKGWKERKEEQEERLKEKQEQERAEKKKKQQKKQEEIGISMLC